MTALDQILGLSDTLNNPAGVSEMLAHVNKIVGNPQTPSVKKRMAGVIGEVLREAQRRQTQPAPKNPLEDMAAGAIKFGDVRFITLHDTDAVSVMKVRVVNLDDKYAAVVTESGHCHFVGLDRLHTTPQEAW